MNRHGRIISSVIPCVVVCLSGVAFGAQSQPAAMTQEQINELAGPPKWIDMGPNPLAPANVTADPDAWLKDPFGHLSARMGEVVDELAVKVTEDPVPQQQERIVRDLDTLIALLEKACSGGSGGRSSANPTRPANESTILGGPGGQGELLRPKDSRHEWADLPPHERREVLQSGTEGYPAGYQEVVEEYFNRLAVERPVTDDTPETE